MVLALLYAAAAATAVVDSSRIDIEQISQVPAQLFDEGSGLPDLTVTSISAAPDGYVWVGSMRGLARFDGHRMVPVPGPDGAFQGPIKSVVASRDGSVWVALERGGVFRWDGRNWQHLGRNAGLANEDALRLRDFGDAKQSRLFAFGIGQVAEWNGKAWVSRRLPAAIAATEIFDVELVQKDGIETLWIASFGQGLIRCIAKAPCEQITIPGPGPRFFEVSSLAWLPNADGDSLWVGSYGGGLAELKNGRWTRFHQGNSALSGDYVLSLELLTVGGQRPQLWAGLRSGLARRSTGDWEMIAPAGRWAGGRINALAQSHDAQGNAQLWVGSDFGAARLRLQGSWRTISQAGNRGNGVWSLLFEQDGADAERLWLGTDGEGLQRYENGQWRRYGIADGLPGMTVRSLARIPDGVTKGTLWAGLWDGPIARLVGDRFVEIPTPWPKSDREAVSIILPVARDEAYVGLRDGGVAHYEAGKWTYFNPSEHNNPSHVRDLQFTGSGNDRTLWATTSERGLASWRHGRWTYFGKEAGLLDNEFLAMNLLDDARGHPVLWLGSKQNSVVRVDVSDPDHPRLISRPALPEPPDRYVYGVVRDGAGDLIVCTNYGAARWHPRGDGGFDSLNFHRSDGLPHDECNGGAMTVDPLGRAWIGTIGGAAVFLPRSLDGEASKAPLRLARVVADGKERTADFQSGHVNLGSNARSIDVQYSLLNGERESLTRYRTQLQPLESKPSDWTDANNRSFTALPPGEYTLRIDARDFAGMVAKPLIVTFDIPLPWWRTKIALSLLAVALLALGALLLRLRERQSRRREQQLVELVRQRTCELENRGVELRRMNEELTRLSYHDALTDLANRRMLLERLHGEWELGHVRGTSLAFVLFDLDQFKAYNDQRGHLAGDDALREVGRRIDAELRKPEDTAGRYGGEEFGVVLPGLALNQAVLVAERIRKAVEDAGLSHPATSEGVVTISVGVAAMVPRAGLSAELLIAAADAALYRAKQAGKNRVEAASGELSD